MLFIATLPDGSRRIASAAHEADVVKQMLERYEQYPDRIEVALWYPGGWDD